MQFVLRAVQICCTLAIFLHFGSAESPKDSLLRFLRSLSGSKVLTGLHNGFNSTADPTQWIRVIEDITGIVPGVWGGDFGLTPYDVSHRQTMIDEAIHQWKAGSAVLLTWHSCKPEIKKDIQCSPLDMGAGKLSDDEWNSLLVDDGCLNNIWKSNIDAIVPYLEQLRDAGVAVLWMPLHQINQDSFWWAGNFEKSRQLYRLTHTYLNSKVDNLIWVWNVADSAVDLLVVDIFRRYWPGKDYVDVASLSIWEEWWDETKPPYWVYQNMLAIAEGKPIAMGPGCHIPTLETLKSQDQWVFYVAHGDFLYSCNANASSIKEGYNNSKVLNQGELRFCYEVK